MRELKILNKNYEVANLYTVVYEGYTIKEIIEDAPVFSVTPPQHYLDYWQKIYDYFKTGTKVPGYTYLPQGQSKYDVAYTNKTIDDPIAELNGHTLREVFEDGVIEPYSSSSFTTIYDNLPIPFHAYYLNSGIVNYQSVSLNKINTSQKNLYVFLEYDLIQANGINNIYMEYKDVSNDFIRPLDLLNNTVSNKNKYSFVSYINEQASNLSFIIQTLDANDLVEIKINKLFGIDIGTLGLVGISAEQIDYYYSLYISRKNISKKSLTYADIFDTNINNEILNDSASNTIINGNTISKDPNGTGTTPYYFTNRLFIASKDYRNKKVYYFNEWIYESTIDVYYAQSTPYSNMLILNNQKNKSSAIIQHTDYASYVRNVMVIDNMTIGLDVVHKLSGSIDLSIFDELITKEQLDTMLAHYLLVKNIVIYPEIYVPTDPTGFGNRYSFLELNKKVYGHELDFENMQLNLLFGVYKNAYDSYNQLMNFIINNEGIISYDYGKGVRYSDIRLIKSPKTELDDGRYLKEKFDFKRLTPFYTLEQGPSLTIKNTHDWNLKLIVSGTVNTNIVYIEAEETTSGLTKTVKFDFTAITKPFNFYYNSETKQILINGINNGYQYIDFTQGISFISLPKDTEHLIWTTGITNPSIIVKKWVID